MTSKERTNGQSRIVSTNVFDKKKSRKDGVTEGGAADAGKEKMKTGAPRKLGWNI